MKAKIKDIAHFAKVSTGTVDRVIHNRGRVADETKARVLQAMERLNYEPDILARTLARKENPNVFILLPYPYQDFYWKMIRDGIEHALLEFAPYRLKGQTFYYDMEDAGHFNLISRQILDESPDVILVGTEFHRQTLHFLKKCNEKNIPCIVLNAEITSVPCLSFIGINSYVVGELAGRIIRSTRERNSVMVVHNTENIENTIHLKNKELGLIDALDNSNLNFFTDHIIFSNQNNGEENLRELSKQIEEEKIDTIYFTTSKAYQFAVILKNRFPDLYIIGHDLIDQNAGLLEQGHIDLIIDQSSYMMGYLSIKSWVDYHILEKKIPAKQYLPLNIIYPENLPYNTPIRQ